MHLYMLHTDNKNVIIHAENLYKAEQLATIVCNKLNVELGFLWKGENLLIIIDRGTNEIRHKYIKGGGYYVWIF